MGNNMKTITLLLGLLIIISTNAGDFERCKDAEQFPELAVSQCATVNIALEHDNKQGKNISLFVRKFPALMQRQGSIWLIAGGPGDSGATFYSLIETFRASFPNLDIFVPDHRGTGASTTICPQESIDSMAGTALVGAEWGECFAHMYANVGYVQAFNVTNAAKDLKQLINTMSGTGKRYVYGVSYGTQLTLRLLQLDNIHLDGVLLDSLVPQQGDKGFDLSKRSQVVDMVGRDILSRCQKSIVCSTENSENLPQQLSELLSKVTSIQDFSESLPQANLSNVLGNMLDVPKARAQLPELIRSLTRGDSRVLSKALSQVTNHYQQLNRGYENFGSSIPLVQVISSSENNLRPELTKYNIKQEAENLLFTSSLPSHLASNNMPTYAKDKFYKQLPSKLPNIMIIHGTLDSKTHHKAAKDHANALTQGGNVKFIDIVDAPHFIALNAPSCFKKLAVSFITNEDKQGATCEDKNVLLIGY